MRCIYCGTPLSAIDYCTGCGADVTLQKRIVRISNLLYNEGLEKASVRDLSGAISCLKRSLKFNKENIDARNLLGLVYYETGEVVSALSEWVISKNTSEENNAADFYIAKLQSNKNKLETINQTIKKYNQALLYCKQDDEDMAVIQLKKVLAQNPNLIKAYHLLALVYMKQQEYEKARKLLKKAAQIDTTNTTTLRYLHEIEEATGVGTNLNKNKGSKRFRKTVDGEEKEQHMLGPVSYRNGNDVIIQPTTFRDSSAMATFLNIFMGFVLGAALIWFLGIPANTRKINQEASKSVTDANTKLASETAKVTSLEKEIEDICLLVGDKRVDEDYILGFKSAMNEHGISAKDDRIYVSDFTLEDALRVSGDILNRKPKAVMTASDLMACAAVQASRTRGLLIPADISVTGFDDVLYASINQTPITTVRQPIDEMCSIALSTLLKMINGKAIIKSFEKKVVLPPQLVIRQTTP